MAHADRSERRRKVHAAAALAQCASYRGDVLLDGRDARRWRPRAFARAVGVLAQTHMAGYAFTVEELVTMGRYAYTRGFLRAQDPHGKEAVRRALEAAGLSDLRARNVQTLSGGELQRAFSGTGAGPGTACTPAG